MQSNRSRFANKAKSFTDHSAPIHDPNGAQLRLSAHTPAALLGATPNPPPPGQLSPHSAHVAGSQNIKTAPRSTIRPNTCCAKQISR